MLLANDPTGNKVSPVRGARGICPTCGAELIPKCGEIVIHHWAHIANDCDPWSEPETPWHADMKALFPAAYREVTMGPHRADVAFPGRVIEFQHSPISAAEIQEREAFYGKNLVWVIDVSAIANESFRWRQQKYGYSYRWMHPRRSWYDARRQIYFWFSDQFFKVGKLYPDEKHFALDMNETSVRPCAGWGYHLSVAEFVSEMKKSNATLFDR